MPSSTRAQLMHQKRAARWVLSSGVNLRDMLVRTQESPSAKRAPDGQQSHIPTLKIASKTSSYLLRMVLYWDNAALLSLLKRWVLHLQKLLPLAHTLSITPTCSACSSPRGTVNPNSAPIKVLHSPLAPQSHMFTLPAGEGNKKTTMSTCRPFPRSQLCLLQAGAQLNLNRQAYQ